MINEFTTLTQRPIVINRRYPGAHVSIHRTARIGAVKLPGEWEVILDSRSSWRLRIHAPCAVPQKPLSVRDHCHIFGEVFEAKYFSKLYWRLEGPSTRNGF